MRGSRGRGQHLPRRAALDDFATVEEQDPVGDLTGEGHLVGDDHHGQALAGEVPHDAQNLAHPFGIEGGGRFIEEDRLGLHGQGAGDAHALLLAA